MFKIFIKQSWPLLIIGSVMALLIPFAYIGFYSKWILDINVWLGEIFFSLFLFQIMMLITQKIKNDYLQLIISLVITLFIGNTLRFTFFDSSHLWLNIVQSIALVTASNLVFYHSYKRGWMKGVKLVARERQVFNQTYESLDSKQKDRFKKEIDQAINFIKKNPFATYFLQKGHTEKDFLELKQNLLELDVTK
ncbi:MAG: hypothetical protein FWE16_03550 [Firmicutes bacterium]|nr:hypothetical protein [Bacillota bacterium]